MMKYLLTLLLFMAASVSAVITDIDSTDFPYQLTDNDSVRIVYADTIVLDQDDITPAPITVNGSGYSAWIIYGNGAENTYVDGNEAVIYFDSGGTAGTNEIGIGIVSSQSTGKGPFIKNLTIIREVGNDTLSGTFCRAMALEGGADSTILQDVNLTVDGHEGICLEWHYPGPNSYIRSCEFWAKSASFHRRDHFYESVGAVHISKKNVASEADSGSYQVIIDSCVVHESHHFSIAVYDAAFEIKNTTVTNDVWNLFWEETCYPGACGNPNSWANGYALVANLCKAGTRIHHNTIYAGTSHYGTRGILFEDQAGTAAYHNMIDSNYLYLHHGPDGENTDGDLRGIRVRTIQGTGTRYTDIIGNYIEGWTDTDTATHHIGANADLLQFGLVYAADSGYLTIQNNTVICRPLDATGTRCCAGSYGKERGVYPYEDNNTITGNKYYSGDYAVYWGDDYNGFGAFDFTLIGDTFSMLVAGDSGSNTGFRSFMIGGNGNGDWACSPGLTIRDGTFINGAYDSMITFVDDSVNACDTNNITFEATLSVTVIGGRNDAPVVNAACSVFTTPGTDTTFVFADTTDSTGVLSGLVTYFYYQGVDYPTGADTTDFNDFLVKAYLYDDDSTEAYTVAWNAKNDTIVIAERSGTVGAVSIPITGLFIHYSVGQGIWGFPGLLCLQERLDTTTLIVNDDTVDFQFRDYQSNADLGGAPMGQLDVCLDYTSRADYDLRNGTTDKIRIKKGDDGPSTLSSDILDNMFNDSIWDSTYADTAWRQMFKTHTITSDSVILGGWDIIIDKNPYGCWYFPSQVTVDSSRVWFLRVREFVASHPEMFFMFAFGTPTIIGDASTGIDDSIESKINYDLAAWFASDSFHVNLDTGAYKNFRTSEFYRALTETENKADKYFLDSANWDNGAGHMNVTGYGIAQDSLYLHIIDAARSFVEQLGAGATPAEPEEAVVTKRVGGIKIGKVKL
jgi:hypothetical protein